MIKPTKVKIAERYLLKKTAIDAKVIDVAKTVSAFLDANKVKHAIAGGMAVALHGYPRMTRDVDIVVPASARSVIERLGKTTPISGHLSGISVKVSGIAVDFLFVGGGLRAGDIAAPRVFADLPIIGIEPLVVMKIETGRVQDHADVVELVKAGKVPLAGVRKRLSPQDREDFDSLVEIAKLEKKGDTRKARRMLLAMHGR